jgi:PAS domain-containing protein
VSLPLLLTFTPATLFLGLLLQDGVRRAETEQALRESEARFRSLLQDIPGVAVQGYGPDGTINFWNAASERLYGFSAEEAIGRKKLDSLFLSDCAKVSSRRCARCSKPIMPFPPPNCC